MKNEKYLNLHIITSKIQKAVSAKTDGNTYEGFIKNISTGVEINKKKQVRNVQLIKTPENKNLTVKKIKTYNHVLVKEIKKYKILTAQMCVNIQKLVYINCIYKIIQQRQKWEGSTKQ